MRNYITIIFFGFAFLPGSAQNIPSVWNMDDCMDYAVKHSNTVKKQEYGLSSAKADLQAAAASFLPSVNASAAAQYNWGRNIDPSTNTYNNVTTFNNYYDIYASIYLFDGGQVINSWKQAKIARQQGMNNVQKARDDKAIEIMQDFVDVVYCHGCTKFATQKLNDSRRTLHKTERQEELGMKGKPDVAQIKAQVAEDDYNLTHQQNLYNTALLKLKSDMNLPASDSLTIDTLLLDITPDFRMESTDEIYAYASTNNPAALAAKLNVKNLKLQYNINKGKLMPSISLAAGVSTSYYRNFSGNTSPLSFSNQFKNNRGEYVGATLKIPIFNQLSGVRDLRKARNNLRIAQADEDEALRKLRTDIEQSVMDRNGYAKEVVQMISKVDADAWAYHITQRKFEEGLMNAIDLQTSANTLLQSRISLLQKRMLYIMKDRLVTYYKGNGLITENK